MLIFEEGERQAMKLEFLQRILFCGISKLQPSLVHFSASDSLKRLQKRVFLPLHCEHQFSELEKTGFIEKQIEKNLTAETSY